MNGAGRYVVAAIAVVVATSGCGGGAKASERETRAVAKRYAAAIVERHDATAAAALAPTLPVSEIRINVALNRKDSMHVVSDPIAGCPTEQVDPFSMPTGGRCYSIQVRGTPVPDRRYPAYGTIRFGTLFVSVSRGEPPTVQAESFTGGACGVKLRGRRECAHLSPVIVKALQKTLKNQR